MIRRIRGARVDYRTGILIIALALLVWGVMAYVRMRDLVPEEYTRPVQVPTP